MKPIVAPSILAARFTNLESEVRQMESAGAQMIHVDVMDGHFVPNLTIGLPVIQALRKVTDLHLDVHLMISNPDLMAVRYVEAGADSVSVHYEAAIHLDQILSSIRALGAWSGVVLNPHTPVSVLEEALPKCDFVLIMSVNPGFGGQEFISTSFQKVRRLRDLIENSGCEVRIEIDGGIDPENTESAVHSGVDILVAGTAIFGSAEPGRTLQRMQRIADAAWRQCSAV